MNLDKKPVGHYKQKADIIIDKVTNQRYSITHWDHFHVNRMTGSVMDNAFTATRVDEKKNNPALGVVASCTAIGDLDDKHSRFLWEGYANG